MQLKLFSCKHDDADTINQASTGTQVHVNHEGNISHPGYKQVTSFSVSQSHGINEAIKLVTNILATILSLAIQKDVGMVQL